MPTISTSQVAAPAFIAAATGRKVYQGFQLAGQYVHLTDLAIQPTGLLAGRSVREVQADNRVNIVMHLSRSRPWSRCSSWKPGTNRPMMGLPQPWKKLNIRPSGELVVRADHS